jgi:hypothetical protein
MAQPQAGAVPQEQRYQLSIAVLALVFLLPLRPRAACALAIPVAASVLLSVAR